MNAIIIGGVGMDHALGRVVEARYHSEMDMGSHVTELYEVSPEQYRSNGDGPVFFIREHLALLPPEEECEEDDVVYVYR